MIREDVRALVQQLSREHKNDRDGGHSLVAAFKHAREGLTSEGRAEFVRLLADFVREQEPELWAVALETLVQLGQNEEVATLASELIGSVRDGGRKDYVVLGLLRLSVGKVVEPVVEHIRDALRNPRPLTMPMTAALCKVDPETGLELAATYFESIYGIEKNAEIDGQIAALVRNLIAIQERLIAELVRRLMVRKPNAGRWLSQCIREYLSLPWTIEDLGAERCRALREKVGGSEHTLN